MCQGPKQSPDQALPPLLCPAPQDPLASPSLQPVHPSSTHPIPGFQHYLVRSSTAAAVSNWPPHPAKMYSVLSNVNPSAWSRSLFF